MTIPIDNEEPDLPPGENIDLPSALPAPNTYNGQFTTTGTDASGNAVEVTVQFTFQVTVG